MNEVQSDRVKSASRASPSPAVHSPRARPSALAMPRRSGKAALGLNSPRASLEAKRIAALVLEVLAGTRTPTDAAASLQVSLPRYYQLEGRAFQGLVAACEPLPRGRSHTAEHQVDRLRKELQRLQREHARQQALVRAAQRTIGLSVPDKPNPASKNSTGTKPKRLRRPTARALKAVRALRGDLAQAAHDSARTAAAQAEAAPPAAPSARSLEPAARLSTPELLGEP